MWHFPKGYVIIQIEGVYPERLASLLQQAGVPTWDICRPAPGGLQLSLPAAAFSRLHGLNRRCRCRIRIREKRGGRRLIRALWARRVLLLGMVFTVLLALWASHRVWFIDLKDCGRMDEAVLLEALFDQGVRPGRNLKRLPLAQIADFVAARYEELAFLELHVDGVILRVRAKEALMEGDRLDLSQPCDVVAAKAAVVTSVTCYAGRPRVKAGERVEPGQLLLSGAVTARDGSMTYPTHAYGEVLGAVLYEARVPAPVTGVEWASTGSEAPYGALYVGQKRLLFRKSPFSEADLILEEKPVRLSPWPIWIRRGVYREKGKLERPLSQSERREAALFQAERDALLQVPRQAKIIMINRYTVETGGTLYGVCAVTAEENIGTTKEIR